MKARILLHGWRSTRHRNPIDWRHSQTAMERELKEELGLEISLEGIRPAMTVNFSTGFDDIYTMTRDIILEDLHLQYEEVRAAQWASQEQVLAMIEEDIFVPYHKDLIRFLFYMRNHKSALTHGRGLRRGVKIMDFEQIYKEYFSIVYRFILSLSLHPEIAECIFRRF